jgi:hypothetical protein
MATTRAFDLFAQAERSSTAHAVGWDCGWHSLSTWWAALRHSRMRVSHVMSKRARRLFW